MSSRSRAASCGIRAIAWLLLATSLAVAPACDGGDATGGAPDGGAAASSSPDGSGDPARQPEPFRLATAPADEVVSVLAARNDLEADGETEFVVEGRVQDIIRGVYAFWLVDGSLDWCHDGIPWDYCDYPVEQVQASRLLVRFARADDADARPVRLKEGRRPAWRPVDLVRVVGHLRDLDTGTRVLIATGYWPVERPDIDWHVDWPEYR